MRHTFFKSILSLKIMSNSKTKVNSKQWSMTAPTFLVSALMLSAPSSYAADMTEAAVQAYASNMKQAANAKDISRVSRLVADDVLISMSRNGKTTSLNKQAYLKLLQDSWSQTTSYNYDINISNIVTSGDKAKANLVTTENWVKNGKKTKLTSSSRATLTFNQNNAVLLRAVSQVSIE